MSDSNSMHNNSNDGSKNDTDSSKSGHRVGVSMIIDRSMSMVGKPIEMVNEEAAEGLYFLQRNAIASVRTDLQVITVGKTALVVVDFARPCDVQIRRFNADGSTPLCQGVLLGVEALYQHAQDCQAVGMNCIASVLAILSDGVATDVTEIQDAATKALASISRKCCVVPIVTPLGNRAAIETLCGTKAFMAGRGELPRVFRSLFKAVESALSESFTLDNVNKAIIAAFGNQDQMPEQEILMRVLNTLEADPSVNNHRLSLCVSQAMKCLKRNAEGLLLRPGQ